MRLLPAMIWQFMVWRGRAMKIVKDWLQQMLWRMFQPISRSEALRIATDALADHARGAPLVCHGTKPDNCHIYCDTSEPCWHIYAPWSDDKDRAAIRSSRVILVGKLTGIIHYDGSVAPRPSPRSLSRGRPHPRSIQI